MESPAASKSPGKSVFHQQTMLFFSRCLLRVLGLSEVPGAVFFRRPLPLSGPRNVPPSQRRPAPEGGPLPQNFPVPQGAPPVLPAGSAGVDSSRAQSTSGRQPPDSTIGIRALETLLGLRVFTPQEALLQGVPYCLLRGRHFKRVARGFYALSSVVVTELDFLAALTRKHPSAVITHVSAARVWGLPLPSRLAVWEPDAPVHLRNGVKRRGKIVGQVRWGFGELPADDVVLIRHVSSGTELRIMTRERTFLDLCKSLSLMEATQVADHLLRVPREQFEARTNPYSTMDSLRSAVRKHRKIRGLPMARAALRHARVGADSPMETTSRLVIVAAGFPEPSVNKPITVLPNSLRTPDLQLTAYRLAIEYDGVVHLEPSQIARDAARAHERKSVGWSEIIARADDLHFRDTVIPFTEPPSPFHIWDQRGEEWRFCGNWSALGRNLNPVLPDLPWNICGLTERLGIILERQGFDLAAVKSAHPGVIL